MVFNISLHTSDKKRGLLIAVLLFFCTSTAFAYDWGENFSWSVECNDGARYETYGPESAWIYGDDMLNEDGMPLYPLLGVDFSLTYNATFVEAYLEWEDSSGDIYKDNLEILNHGWIIGYEGSIGDGGSLWLGNAKCSLSTLYDDFDNVPCIKLHKNCRNVVIIKVRTIEVIPTTINFNHSGSINGHPLDYYDDVDGEKCYWHSLRRPVMVIAHRTFYVEDIDPYTYEEPLVFCCDPDSVFTEVLDWVYDDNHDTSGLVYGVSFELDDWGYNVTADFSPDAIDGPGEYNVNISYVFPEDMWHDLALVWGTNFQFDLDGGGAVEYTLSGKEGVFTVDGEGLQGKYHSYEVPLGLELKIKPNNPGKVLDSFELHYDSGLNDSVKVIPLNFEFDEVNECYVLSDCDYDFVFCQNGYMDLFESWMSTFVVRFKDDERIIEFADPAVKQICVENWDTNGDGEISRCEAAAVTNIGTVFSQNKTIKSFDELKYFSSLTYIDNFTVRYPWNRHECPFWLYIDDTNRSVGWQRRLQIC